jgi:AIPR protein
MAKGKKSFTFKVESFRKLPDPIAPDDRERYFAICETRNLPTDFPMETNPREQNLNSKVAKKIREGFFNVKDKDDGPSEDNPLFHLLNRGLLISADSADFNNHNNLLTIEMTDQWRHGLVDGGHTYKIVTSKEGPEPPVPQYITLEIITGVEDDFEAIAGARNTSVQVKQKSLAELEGRLDVVHELVKGTPFESDIAYVENEDKPIDVENVIALLTMFHTKIHGVAQPWYTYSIKARTLQVYLDNEKSYAGLAPIAPKIFELHDHIKRTFPEYYKSVTGGNFGRLGALKEIGYKDGKLSYPLYFSPKKNGDLERVAHDIPGGFVYPILGALRVLAEPDSKGKYRWLTEPISFYGTVASKLVELTMEASGDFGRNAMAVGKSPRHWEGLYSHAAATYFRTQASA